MREKQSGIWLTKGGMGGTEMPAKSLKQLEGGAVH